MAQQLLLTQVPANLDLKFNVMSELGRYYMTVGDVSMQKQTARKALNMFVSLNALDDEERYAHIYHVYHKYSLND